MVLRMSSLDLYLGNLNMFMHVAADGNLFLGSPPAALSLAIISGGYMNLKPSRGGLSVPVTNSRNFSR